MVSFTSREADGLCAWGMVVVMQSVSTAKSVSEYVTTNVTAKPVTYLHEPNPCCAVVSHMCRCKTLTVSRK